MNAVPCNKFNPRGNSAADTYVLSHKVNEHHYKVQMQNCGAEVKKKYLQQQFDGVD